MKKRVRVLCAVLFSATLLAGFGFQADFGRTLQEKLTKYYQRHVPVKIHLTFNQPRYAAGDTVFYKVYFFTADDFLPIGGRRIITVRLVDIDGQAAHQARVLVTNGSGFNQIPISGDLQPGKYTVVAFDEVMTEYDSTLFFQHPLWVAGPRHMQDVPQKQDLSFYPEGGHFVAGIANKVVIKGPPNLSGKIQSVDQLEMAAFNLDEKGLGLCFMTPRANVTYVAVAGDLRAELPVVEKAGVGLLVHVPVNGSALRVTVQIPEAGALRSETLHLSMTAHGRVYYTADLFFREKNFQVVALPQDKLPEGIARITIFRHSGDPVADRLVYIHDQLGSKAGIALPKQTFAVREEIPVAISVMDDEGIGVSSILAVTVYHEDYLPERMAERNIVDNAYFYGDLPGTLSAEGDVSRDAKYFSSLDNYLVTCTWKRFSWQDVWTETPPANPFKAFLNLAGRAVRRDGEPLPDSTLITFFLQKSVMTYVADVGPSGEFDLSLLMDFYGEEEIFYHVEHRGEVLSDVAIKLNAGYPYNVQSRPVRSLQAADQFYHFSIKRHEIDRSYSNHLFDRVNTNPPSLNALVEEEIFGADVVVSLDDYYLFPSMAETLKEVVPMLQHRRQQNRDNVRMYFDDRDRLAEGQPLFIIDGVITDNTTYFLGLKPADVVSIKIVYSMQKLQTFGSIGKNGIVLVETKIPGNSKVVPRSEQTFTAEGLQHASRTQHKRTVPKDARVPDLRTNIYWNPMVETDSSGRALIKIPASDVTGRFRIKVEGFTEQREPVFAEARFNISFFD